MSNIWFSSDQHFLHKNICRGTTTWDLGSDPLGGVHGINSVRDFDAVEDMNEALVEGINKNVKQDDILYCTGDWSFAGIENIWNFKKRLIVKEIHFIIDNHDHHIESNHFIGEANRNTHDLFASVQHYKRISIHGQEIIMFHYPMRSWAVTGHCHDSMRQEYGKSLDCGVDTAKRLLVEYRLFSFEEIRSIMNKRQINIVDHHGPKTSG